MSKNDWDSLKCFSIQIIGGTSREWRRTEEITKMHEDPSHPFRDFVDNVKESRTTYMMDIYEKFYDAIVSYNFNLTKLIIYSIYNESYKLLVSAATINIRIDHLIRGCLKTVTNLGKILFEFRSDILHLKYFFNTYIKNR